MTKQDKLFMQNAIELAKEAASVGEIPVGAVIVKDGEIIASGRNECEALHDATAHAERLSVTRAGEKIGSWRLSDCTLYVTMEPCPMCMGAILNSRISRVVYGTRDGRAGACESLLRLSSYPLGSDPAIEGGVMEAECLALLRDFFAKRRK